MNYSDMLRQEGVSEEEIAYTEWARKLDSWTIQNCTKWQLKQMYKLSLLKNNSNQHPI
jgi:hypothetical protein